MRERTKREMLAAVDAADSKKAEDLTILEMDRSSGAFTDYFILCTASNPRQMQSIADEIELQVKRQTGTYAHQVEGYREAEWILVDYVDFVVHVFSPERRAFYGLERLWRSAKTVTIDDLRSAQPGEEGVSSEPEAPALPRKQSKRPKTLKLKPFAVRTAAKKQTKKAAKPKTKSARKSKRT